MESMRATLHKLYDQLNSLIGLPDFSITFVDVMEVVIIAVILYYLLLWFKSTRAWNLLKGILIILGFALVAVVFQMNTILWLARNMLNVGLIALVIIFQPELRHSLENLGGKNILGRFFNSGKTEEKRFSDRTIDELIKACYSMGKVKTGALIVIENTIVLDEFVRTGIDIDALVTSQILINIFEKNTQLHDGALIIRGDRIVSATCYLPLSDSMRLSKELGTRHRAAVGVSEVSDSMTIIVSEETGKVALAYEGMIYRDLTPDSLKERISSIQQRSESAGRGLLRRRGKDGK